MTLRSDYYTKDIVETLDDLLQYCNASSIEDLQAAVYRGTECGASIQVFDGTEWYTNEAHWDVIPQITAIKFVTIVEGSDAELETSPIDLPATSEDIEQAIEWLEDEVNTVIGSDKFKMILEMPLQRSW